MWLLHHCDGAANLDRLTIRQFSLQQVMVEGNVIFFCFCTSIHFLLSPLTHTFISTIVFLAGLGGSVGCAVRLETRRSRVQPPPADWAVKPQHKQTIVFLPFSGRQDDPCCLTPTQSVIKKGPFCFFTDFE